MIKGGIPLGIWKFFEIWVTLDGPLVKIHFFLAQLAFKSGFHPHFLHLVVFSTLP
jgi:hypothetical protein